MAKRLIRKPMTLMVISPLLERIHMALMTGATAAAMGRPVTFFFSKGAAQFLDKSRQGSLMTSEGLALSDMEAGYDEKGIADCAVLLDGLAAMDVRFIACETALREHDILPEDMISRPHVEIAGLAGLIESGEGGDWLTF